MRILWIEDEGLSDFLPRLDDVEPLPLPLGAALLRPLPRRLSSFSLREKIPDLTQ